MKEFLFFCRGSERIGYLPKVTELLSARLCFQSSSQSPALSLALCSFGFSAFESISEWETDPMDFYSGARGCLCGPEPIPGRMSPDLPAADRFCWVPSLPHQGAGGLCRTSAQDASPAAASMLGTCAEGHACALTRGSGRAEQRLICLHSPLTFEGRGWACAHAHTCPYRR